MERGASSGRALLVGAALAVLIAGGIAAGLLLGGSSSPDATPTSPAATTPPTPTSPSPTGAAALRAEIRTAYLDYWDVYAQALLELDPSRLEDVLTGKALQIVREQVEEQRSRNEPVRIDVDHHILRITLVNPTTASVDDRYFNRSVRLDPDTMEPIEQPPNMNVQRTYTLKLVNGTWKVSFIIGRE